MTGLFRFYVKVESLPSEVYFDESPTLLLAKCCSSDGLDDGFSKRGVCNGLYAQVQDSSLDKS